MGRLTRLLSSLPAIPMTGDGNLRQCKQTACVGCGVAWHGVARGPGRARVIVTAVNFITRRPGLSCGSLGGTARDGGAAQAWAQAVSRVLSVQQAAWRAPHRRVLTD